MGLPLLKPKHLSQPGAEFIGRFEGFEAAPYNDPVGFATIGYGHLLHKSNVRPADRAKWGRITKARALQLLQNDAEVAAASIRAHVKVKLSQPQFDALVSFAYNEGVGAFETSTLLKKLNARDYAGAADQFLRWDIAGGHHVAGLLTRRKAERRLFLTGRYA